MILERVALRDFGVYRGRHVVELSPPSPDRPVISIGGPNGAGKTAFFDAVQLALFGKMAGPSRCSGLRYEDVLRRAISRGVDAKDGAALEVELRRVVEGRPELVAVRRSWSVREEYVRERVEVRRNGALDPLLSDAWAEHVEELMPARVSRLFFFGGEKLESLADVERSAEALRTAIHGLLGVDLVDQLLADLLVIERRKRTEHRCVAERGAVEAMAVEVQRLEEQRTRLVEEREAARPKLDQAQIALRDAEERFEAGGGDVVARRAELEVTRAALDEELRRVEKELRALAEGAAPLLLVMDLLTRVAADGDAEPALASVHEDLATELPARLRRDLDDADRLLRALGAVDRRLASVPQADAMETLATARAAAREDVARAEHALRRIDEDLARVTRAHERELGAYSRKLKEAVEEQSEVEAASRILACSERVRETMKRFRRAVLDERVRRIEALVLEGFRALVRKPALVTELRVDPRTFTIKLQGADRRELSPERLGAGERQLLAVAILWGIGRASGRALPVVIDSPLGRLDSVHRDRLVERYLPNAGRQVILLSTGDDLDARQAAKLQPHVGRSYVIRHDDGEGTSRIEAA